MSLEQFAYLAQIVGVFGLLISLLYVGRQLQLNRAQMRAEAKSEYYRWVDQVFSRVALDRDFSEVWRKGTADFSDLDEVDKQRAVFHEVGALYMVAYLQEMMDEGMLPDGLQNAADWTYREMLNRQATREAWILAKDSFSESFRDRVRHVLEK